MLTVLVFDLPEYTELQVSELPAAPEFPVLPTSEKTFIEKWESDEPSIKGDTNKILSMLTEMLAENAKTHDAQTV